MKRAIVVGAALAALLVTGSEMRAQTAEEPAEDPVVALVNGEPIHGSDVALFHQSLPEQIRQIPLQMIYIQLLQRLVERKLAATAARQAGLADDAQVRRRITYHEDRVLHESYIVQRVNAELTEERLRAAYDRMAAEKPKADEVHARHILMQSEEDARAVIAELQGGADFVQLAEAKSTGPSAKQGGDLGFFAEDEMVPEFSAAAFALQVGAFTADPVKTQFGWHVIKLEERRTGEAASFEDSKAELRENETKQVIEEISAALRTDAEIKLFNPDGTEMDKTTAEEKTEEKKTE